MAVIRLYSDCIILSGDGLLQMRPSNGRPRRNGNGTRAPQPISAPKDHEFREQVYGIRDLAIFMLDAGGNVVDWTDGLQHIKGYAPCDTIGRHCSMFYTLLDQCSVSLSCRSRPCFQIRRANH